ncbi:ribose-5-phosphate isomerase RpiA [uncultured Chitinophaga sp.]|uniref:ribose-5-phosphate isomerase RpiA n=1 Tax=uncultured Chitinophaga sp. TaxID=339340 RepID=UPI0026174016|nr:ribose-5-phosphate isomerase RpiA [uncultured Chitinophaga sp.]
MASQQENDKQLAATAAAALLVDGMTVGLGTGSTATAALHAIAARHLKITGVPTSRQTAELATKLGIPLADINDVPHIDIALDGADEFTASLDLIKGGGGALLHEKIVAVRSRQLVIMTDASKLVERLGRFRVPVEVIPFAVRYVQEQIAGMGASCTVRPGVITDEGNLIVDADFGLIENPSALGARLKSITGVVEHGIFSGIASLVVMGDNGTVRRFPQVSGS